MTSLLIGIAAVVVSSPIVATIIVAIASNREDRNWSLGGRGHNPTERLARRIVAFHQDSLDDWPRSKAQVQAEAAAAAATRLEWPHLVTTEDRKAS